jgi:hypothetical protein
MGWLNGVFTRTTGRTGWQTDAATGVRIRADLHDNNDNDIADALSNVICRDGQSTISANIPWNGKKITNLAPGSATTDAANFGQLANIPNVAAMTAKTTPVDADIMMIENSASAPQWLKAKLTLLALKTYIYSTFGTILHALALKAVIVDADEFTVSDSVSTPTAWTAKRHTWLDLKKMIEIDSAQRLGKSQGAGTATDLNTFTNTGFYTVAAAAANIPAALNGYLQVINWDASNILQLYFTLTNTNPRSFMRRRAAAAWTAWVETTAIDPLLKKEDGVIVDAGYTQTPRVTPDAPASGSYTPTPDGGNMRQVNSPGTAWSFLAPTKTGNYSMVVLINNPAISGAVTFSGFAKVTGGPHPTPLGKKSLVYITKVASTVTAYVEPMP